jgi:Uma2 family endonuclease
MATPADTGVSRYRFSVADYHRLGETGILAGDRRVELIDGEIRHMNPIGPLHAGTVSHLLHLLSRQLGERALLSVQNPVQLDDFSEPQPDLMVLRPRDDSYTTAHPQPADVFVIVEVADTTERYDREEKILRYARAGIAEAWLVLPGVKTIEQYTEPRGGSYRSVRIHKAGDALFSAGGPELQLALDSLFL